MGRRCFKSKIQTSTQTKMKLDIELLNRLKEEVAENNGVSWYDFTPSRHERNWEEVCRRYSEEVNKKPDTKTAEEVLGQSCYPHECGGMIEIVTKQDALRAIEEYASPLKKRIEELEAELAYQKGANKSIQKYIEYLENNPSTNGKQ